MNRDQFGEFVCGYNKKIYLSRATGWDFFRALEKNIENVYVPFLTNTIFIDWLAIRL